ncbi:YitT family protein, partial [Carboxydothermus pertinax]|uniref:YitT family protein n=1 Tax=Carboxydothermus pertinax TaxID=870242 RepID=UPI00117821BC
LASLYGGVLSGVGLGIVFKFKGSTGGTDLAAAIFRRFTKTNVGMTLLLIDGLVVLASGIVFNPEQALYALISIVVSSWLIDVVQEGLGYARAFFIISDKTDLISDKIINELDRSGTCLKGEGIYTRQEKNVLLAVVNRSEVSRLKEIVSKIDPKAFVIVANVHEVLGEGFKPIAKEGK